MNRLLQGDVGSGKTIVSILISVLAIGNNAQVAVMAPTEILARQHYMSFMSLLKKVNIPCALLFGSMKASERQSILKGLKTGRIPVIIGTHALIQDDVEIQNLGLVIVDEQHRFGVAQRAKIWKKNKKLREKDRNKSQLVGPFLVISGVVHKLRYYVFQGL